MEERYFRIHRMLSGDDTPRMCDVKIGESFKPDDATKARFPANSQSIVFPISFGFRSVTAFTFKRHATDDTLWVRIE